MLIQNDKFRKQAVYDYSEWLIMLSKHKDLMEKKYIENCTQPTSDHRSPYPCVIFLFVFLSLSIVDFHADEEKSAERRNMHQMNVKNNKNNSNTNNNVKWHPRKWEVGRGKGKKTKYRLFIPLFCLLWMVKHAAPFD